MNRCLLTAFVSAMCLLAAPASASALPTKLCKANEATCSATNTYKLGFENFKGTISTMKLEMPGFFATSCTTGKLASTLSEGAGALTGEVWKWNFSSCSSPEECGVATPATEGTGLSAEVEATSGGNGVMRIGKTPTLVLTCASGKCTYTANSIELSVTGAVKEAAISTKSFLAKDPFRSKVLCSETAIFEAKYLIVEPGVPLYVTH